MSVPVSCRKCRGESRREGRAAAGGEPARSDNGLRLLDDENRPLDRQNRSVLELFPDTARIEGGDLTVGGIPAAELVRAHGSPLVVYDEATLRARARAYKDAAPSATIVYGTKAFPNVAVMRILAEEGIGADVSTLGELQFALQAGIEGACLVVHGNNKSREELEAAAAANALVVIDSLEEVELAREAGVTRTLIRVTPGIEADTHEKIRTGHHGSKFGLTPDDALEALRSAPGTEGLHVHIGSQLRDLDAAFHTVRWIAAFAAQARDEADGWLLRTLDLGGGLGVAATPDETEITDPRFRRRAPRRGRPRIRRERRRSTAHHPRARPLAHGTSGRDALHRGLGQALRRRHLVRRRRRRHVRQPPPRALRRPLHRDAREPGRRRAAGLATRSSASTASRATS